METIKAKELNLMKTIKEGRREHLSGAPSDIFDFNIKHETSKHLTEQQKSKIFLEEFRSEGFVIDSIIESNKNNGMFRIAWKDLIEESSTEFEEHRVINLRERVKQSRETQEWKSIVIPSPTKIEDKKSSRPESVVGKTKERMEDLNIEERKQIAYTNPV
mmetsp:Transcript_5041/g.4272  ORF Transcript_5041/g.4272 Transcript_5041/m.4272 type:complete len:160 (+) Transcript_5041:640-1119(+)